MIDLNRLYVDLVLPGFRACFLAAAPSLFVCEYEPQNVMNPLIYSLLDSRSDDRAGQVLAVTYTTFHRVCIPYQDPAGAEAIALSWLDAIPNAVLASRGFEQLAGVEPLIKSADGRIGGEVKIGEGRMGFTTIGGSAAKIRAIDYTSTTLIKLDFRRFFP